MKFMHQGVMLPSGFVELIGYKSQRSNFVAIDHITGLDADHKKDYGDITYVYTTFGVVYAVSGTPQSVAEKIALAR